MFEKNVKLFYLYHGLIVDEDTIHGMNIKFKEQLYEKVDWDFNNLGEKRKQSFIFHDFYYDFGGRKYICTDKSDFCKWSYCTGMDAKL